MKNHKGQVAVFLTLGLVLIGTLITLGSSLFVSNKKTNLASNSRAAGGCDPDVNEVGTPTNYCSRTSLQSNNWNRCTGALYIVDPTCDGDKNFQYADNLTRICFSQLCCDESSKADLGYTFNNTSCKKNPTSLIPTLKPTVGASVTNTPTPTVISGGTPPPTTTPGATATPAPTSAINPGVSCGGASNNYNCPQDGGEGSPSRCFGGPDPGKDFFYVCGTCNRTTDTNDVGTDGKLKTYRCVGGGCAPLYPKETRPLNVQEDCIPTNEMGSNPSSPTQTVATTFTSPTTSISGNTVINIPGVGNAVVDAQL